MQFLKANIFVKYKLQNILKNSYTLFFIYVDIANDKVVYFFLKRTKQNILKNGIKC